MSTNALTVEYRKVIPSRFVTRKDGTPLHCMTCATTLVMGQAYAATKGEGWDTYCAVCSMSIPAQVGGLVKRIEALVTPLGDNIPAEVVAMVEAATPLIERALGGDVEAFLQVKPVLFSVRRSIGQARTTERDANAVDLSSVPAGTYAVPGGDTRLKVRIDKPAKGKWAGFVFVKDGAEYGMQTRYGMQKPGGTYKGQIEAELRIIASDIAAAAKAHGDITSTCSFCKLPLEKNESVKRGYGPTCADNLGLPFDHAAYNAE